MQDFIGKKRERERISLNFIIFKICRIKWENIERQEVKECYDLIYVLGR